MTSEDFPLVSVIIPHFNQPDLLDKCLNSLANQTVDPAKMEVIVVDNGSSVSPADVCAGHQGVTLIFEKEPGPGPARNAGAKIAKAPVLAFIDADCVASPDWAEVIINEFRHENTNIIGGKVKILLEHPSKMSPLEAYESVFSFRQKLYIERDGYSATLNLSARKSVYEMVGKFAGIEFAEDRLWGQKAQRMGYETRYVPRMLVFHPARSNFTEIFGKWNRIIGHDYAQMKKFHEKIRWAFKAIALIASIPLGYLKVMREKELANVPQRMMAAYALTVIRLYRSFTMLRILMRLAWTDNKDWERQ